MIECQQSSDQNKARIRRRERLRNLNCEVLNACEVAKSVCPSTTTDKSSTAVEEVTKTLTETGVTLETPTTSQGRIIIIEFIYLLITIVGFEIS